jgi:hypothetical protein
MTRALCSLSLCSLLLLAPCQLAAQEIASRPSPASENESSWAPNAIDSSRSSPVYRLLPEESLAPVALLPASWREADAAESELPPSAFLERHRQLFSTLIPAAGLAAVIANSIIGYDTKHGFRIHEEGWFGRDTTNGGADKASHLTDYFVITHIYEDVYKMMGYSEKAAILWGFGLAVATGVANEVTDGFTKHGFSWEDVAMDAAGATAASLVSVTHTKDLFGMRVSHVPGSSYTHDVYSADLKLSGLGKRLDLNIGPLRWLLFSVTYGSKGYRVTPPIDQQRQLGFEIGLNLQQILNDLGVKRSTWWGYALHLAGDNMRFPFTGVGMRVDLNRGRWHGPNGGNE